MLVLGGYKQNDWLLVKSKKNPYNSNHLNGSQMSCVI